MNNRFLVSLILGALPLTMMAQDDDMYFVPSKKSVPTTKVRTVRPAPTFHSGSTRSVDEYNRRSGSYYQVVPTDSTGNDIIDFSGELGVYPDSNFVDSTFVDDYSLTRSMTRWDGYEPDIAYLDGYREGRREAMYYSWHSPWYYSSSYYPWYDSYWYWTDPWYGYYGWYDPWYYGWYDPWYYGYGYYRPWYRNYYAGYYFPHYYSGGGALSHYSTGHAGSQNHGSISYRGPRGLNNGRTTTYSAGTFGGRALEGNRSGSAFGGSRSSSTGTTRSYGTSSSRSASSRFGGNGATRTYSNSSSNSSRTTYIPSTPSTSSSGSSFGSSSSSSSSGSFGGGGGSTYGGSRSSGGGGGGGGRFGGRR